MASLGFQFPVGLRLVSVSRMDPANDQLGPKADIRAAGSL
jgi:hypothetical protein